MAPPVGSGQVILLITNMSISASDLSSTLDGTALPYKVRSSEHRCCCIYNQSAQEEQEQDDYYPEGLNSLLGIVGGRRSNFPTTEDLRKAGLDGVKFRKALGGWNIYRRVFTMSRPPERLLTLGPMRHSDACSPPDEQNNKEKHAKKHADHRRCRRDGCLLRYHRAERERERERSNEGDAPSSDERVRPIPDLGDHVGNNVSLFSQNLESQEPKPGGQKTQIQCHHAQF